MITAITNLRNPNTTVEKGLHIAYDTALDEFIVIDLTQVFSYYNRAVFYAFDSAGYRIVISFINIEGTYTIRPNTSFVLFLRAELNEDDKAKLDVLYEKILTAASANNSIHAATTKDWLRLGSTREEEGLLY